MHVIVGSLTRDVTSGVCCVCGLCCGSDVRFLHAVSNKWLFCWFVHTYVKASGNDVTTPHQSQQQQERVVQVQDSRAFFAQRQTGNGAPDDACAREGEPDDVSLSPTTPTGVGGALSTFARDSTRRSLANNAAMWKWLDAQERQQDRIEVCAAWKSFKMYKFMYMYHKATGCIAYMYNQQCVNESTRFHISWFERACLLHLSRIS